MGYITMEDRAKVPLALGYYSLCDPVPRVLLNLPVPSRRYLPTDQYILRMRVVDPKCNNGRLTLPPHLMWLKDSIVRIRMWHQRHFPVHPYVYVTVRAGLVSSTTDDEWHVDGFSMRIPHVPEQNYLFCDSYPTEWLNQNIFVMPNFDPLKHNLHWYIQERANKQCVRQGVSGAWMLIDPYVIHRRSPRSQGQFRVMVRVSLVPIEIQDNTCTQNPLFPVRTYDHIDIRQSLGRYI